MLCYNTRPETNLRGGDMDELVAALEKRRGDIPVVEFARGLGIHFSSYYRLLKGERGLGVNLQRRILRRYPELTLVFLSQVSSGDDQDSSQDAP